MPLRVRDLASSETKFVQRGQASGEDYRKAVAASGAAWEQHTGAAAATWAAAVADAASKGRFASGVTKAGGAKFAAKASTIGSQRYPQGIAAGGDAWAKGFAPYRDTLASIDPPARGLKNSPQNFQRAQFVASALHAKKVGA